MADPDKAEVLKRSRQILDSYESQIRASEFQKESFRQSGQVYQILPEPAFLSEAEQKELQLGSKQLGELIRRLLIDHYSGEKTYRSVLGVDSDLLDRAERSMGVDRKYVNVKDIQMLHGPDLLRGSDGRFYLLEINSFIVSGLPASELNLELLQRFFPQFKALNQSAPPFSQQLAEEFHRQANEVAGKRAKVVVVRYHIPSLPEALIGKKWAGVAKSYRQMLEHQRRIFAQYGIELVTVNPFRPRGGFDATEGVTKRLIRKNGQIHLQKYQEGKLISENPVGFLFSDIVPRHLRWLMRPVMEVYRKGKIRLSHTPGIEILDDKRILKHLRNLASHYKVPLPKFIVPETLSFTKPDGSLNQAAVDKLTKNIKRYVVKGPDGQGGSSVWVGRDLSDKRILEVIEMVKKDPRTFDAQEFIAASRIKVGKRQFMLDFRPLTFLTNRVIDHGGEIGKRALSLVTSTPWSRAISIDSKDSRLNISGKAHAGEGGNVVVLTAEPKFAKALSCRRSILKLGVGQ